MKCRHLFVFDIDWCNFSIDRDIDLVPLKVKPMLYTLLMATIIRNIHDFYCKSLFNIPSNLQWYTRIFTCYNCHIDVNNTTTKQHYNKQYNNTTIEKIDIWSMEDTNHITLYKIVSRAYGLRGSWLGQEKNMKFRVLIWETSN